MSNSFLTPHGKMLSVHTRPQMCSSHPHHSRQGCGCVGRAWRRRAPSASPRERERESFPSGLGVSFFFRSVWPPCLQWDGMGMGWGWEPTRVPSSKYGGGSSGSSGSPVQLPCATYSTTRQGSRLGSEAVKHRGTSTCIISTGRAVEQKLI